MPDPLIQPFRDRPRAVVILPCQEARLTALGADLRDGRHWLSFDQPVFDLFIVIQGRIEVGDWIGAQCLHATTGRETWYKTTQVGQLTSAGTAHLRFADVSPAFESKGWYTLRVFRNGRYCGRAKLEAI